ncbi:MAG: hypothetical protein ACI8Y4_000510 [Candidatus Poriferisodalaceae bacterium]
MTAYEQPGAPLGFQSLPAADKLSWFEEQFEATAYTPVTGPDLAFPPKRQLAKVLAVVMCPRRLVQTLDRTDDLMDPARPKVIHTQGAVACIAITIGADSPYTGILAPSPSGGATGLIRMSLAAPPTRKKAFVPGIALKCLIDGRESADLLAVNHTNGQGRDHNLFSNSLSHDLMDQHQELRLPQKMMKKLFMRVSSEPRRLSIEHFGTHGRNGHPAGKPRVPDKLTFVPTAEARALFVGRAGEDYRTVLGEVSEGTRLYDIVATDDAADGPARTIGAISVTTPFVASLAGDRLFFRHVQHKADRVAGIGG